MEEIEYENIYKNEGRHFFYVSTHKLVISLIKKYYPSKKMDLKILDAGCGTGLLAKKLQKKGNVVGVDISPNALKFARARGVKLKKSSIEKLPFRSNHFDIVISIDVLTHKSIKNDLEPLSEFYRVLKPKGILILRVSANSWLHLIHDKHVHMNHRYDKKQLHKKLSRLNFSVEKLSFVHSVLFPLIVIRQFWENIIKPKGTKSAITRINPLINNLMIKILLMEVNFLMKFDVPFGVGLVAVARK